MLDPSQEALATPITVLPTDVSVPQLGSKPHLPPQAPCPRGGDRLTLSPLFLLLF